MEGSFSKSDIGTSVFSIPIGTSLIQSAVNSTGYAGFQLSPSSTNGQVMGITARELYNSAPGARTAPTLTIGFIPEPSTFVLAAVGLLGLLFFGWRQRR